MWVNRRHLIPVVNNKSALDCLWDQRKKMNGAREGKSPIISGQETIAKHVEEPEALLFGGVATFGVNFGDRQSDLLDSH
jgi:hypothetical protein